MLLGHRLEDVPLFRFKQVLQRLPFLAAPRYRNNSADMTGTAPHLLNGFSAQNIARYRIFSRGFEVSQKKSATANAVLALFRKLRLRSAFTNRKTMTQQTLDLHVNPSDETIRVGLLTVRFLLLRTTRRAASLRLSSRSRALSACQRQRIATIITRRRSTVSMEC